jgi:hypothetical protein
MNDCEGLTKGGKSIDRRGGKSRLLYPVFMEVQNGHVPFSFRSFSQIKLLYISMHVHVALLIERSSSCNRRIGWLDLSSNKCGTCFWKTFFVRP